MTIKKLTITSILILTCLTIPVNSQVQLIGNLSTYVNDFITSSAFPLADGNNYQHPTTAEKTAWSNCVSAIYSGNYSLAHSTAAGIGYRVVQFYDQTKLKSYYILEKLSSSSNHWGMFIYNPTAKRSKLFIQAPHPKYDMNTGRQGIDMFRELDCRAFYVSGTHRCNSTTNSNCSGTSTVCGTYGPYKISDQPHTVDGTLQLTTMLLNNFINNLFVIQTHGFSMGEGDPHLIISNGTRLTPSIDYIAILRDNLLAVDDTLTFKIAHIDLSWDKLIALTNTQGRLINNSSNPCSNNATITTGRFIHIEQALSLRNTAAARKKLSDATALTFPLDEISLTAPNGGEVVLPGDNYNITWTSSGFVGAVKIEFTTDNGSTWSIITSSTENDGVYTWVVPSIGTWRAKVRISDTSNNMIADASNTSFKIKHTVYPATGNSQFADPAAPFGPRKLNGVYDFHRGIDYAGVYNTPILSSHPGVIVRKEDSTQTAGTSLERFGNWMLVKIDSEDGQPWHNAYLHLNGFHKYNVGDTVTTADTIGFMGRSGTGINTVHLHFEFYKNLSGTAINKDKAKNPVEILPYDDLNAYSVTFINRNDSTAVQIEIPETELDFDAIALYGSTKTKTVSYNNRVGIDPDNNDNPRYNEVFIDPDNFREDSLFQRIRFWTKDSETGVIDSIKIMDVKGHIMSFTRTSINETFSQPVNFELHQNYPNPFNPATTITISLAEGKKITLDVVSVTGELVSVITTGYYERGNYSFNFDGRGLSSGLYFCRLKTDTYTKSIKLILMK